MRSPHEQHSLQGHNGFETNPTPLHRAGELLPSSVWLAWRRGSREDRGTTADSNYSSVAIWLLQHFISGVTGESERERGEQRGKTRMPQTDRGSCRLNMRHHPVALPQSLLFFPSLLVVHNALSYSLQLFINPQLSTVNNNVSSWRERGRGASLRQCILMA